MSSSIEEQQNIVNQFLLTLFEPADTILFRTVGNKKGVVFDKVWHPPLGRSQIKWLSNINKLGGHIYYGVCPRDLSDDHQPISVKTLWVDIDIKQEGLLNGVEAAIIRVAWRTPPPTITVLSGHGVHVYWKLAIETRNNITCIAKPVLQGLAKTVGGDMVWDLTRLMRLPGFYNTKGERPWPVVKIYSLNPAAVYKLSDFDGSLGNIDIDQHTQQLIEQGNKGKYSSRSEADWAVICRMVEVGYDDDQIRAVFTNPQYGISEKYLDNQKNQRGSGDKYLRFTIQKARRLTKSENQSTKS